VIGLALQGVASAETLELRSGGTLEDVEVLDRNEERLLVEHPVLGRLEIPVSEIKPPEEPEVRPGLFGTSFMEGWNKALSAGFSGSSGVTKETTINAGLELKNKTDHHRDAFIANYFYASADGERSNNEFTADHLHDFLFTDSKWIAYIGGGYKYDQFQSWDHRIVGSAGAGYDFLRDDLYVLTGRIGPGFTITRGGSDDREDFNGVAVLQGSWTIVDGIAFNAEAAYFPVLNDMPDFRTVGLAELKIAIGAIKGLSFKAGGSYEYDSQNVEERNDRKWYGSLVYDF
jgi:putative salt-induced outer membrane protein YdiY